MQRQQSGGRGRGIAFIIGAILIALGLAWLVWRALHSAQEQVKKAQEGPERVKVVVAARDLYMGIPIAAEDLAVVDVLPGAAPQDLVFLGEHLEQVVNLTPRERILQGEVLRVERMARREAGIGLNAIIAPGKRAMTIDTDAGSNLGGHLQPGNWVDVIVTIRPDDRQMDTRWVTETILQGIKILAVGDSLSALRPNADDKGKAGGGASANAAANPNAPRRGKPTVTVELTLEESEKLALAVSRGDIHLVLRSDIDIAQQETTGPLNTRALLGLTEAPAPVAEAPRPTSNRQRAEQAAPHPLTTAEVIEGGSTTTVRFDESGTKVDESRARKR
jgi:pilus assembly protein CpaB